MNAPMTNTAALAAPAQSNVVPLPARAREGEPAQAVVQLAEDRIDYWLCYETVAPQLLNNGFEPIPVEGKRAMGLGWQSVRIDEAYVRRTAAWCGGASVGLRTGHLVAIDIDITDPVVAERVSQSAREHFGEGPIRIGLAPKLLILFATDTPVPKHESALWVEPGAPADSKGHRVEILGAGQQFVAYGRHAKTNQPYRWPNGGPLDIEPWALPIVDPMEVHRWVDEVVPSLIPENWEIKKKGSRSRSGPIDRDDALAYYKPQHTDVTLDDARWILEKLNELQPERCDDREDWLRVGMALHHQFAASPEAFELWFDWSSVSDRFDPDICEAHWDGFQADQREDQVTIGSIKSWLGDLWRDYRAEKYPRGVIPAPQEDAADEFAQWSPEGLTVDYGDDAVARLRAMSQAEVRSSWLTIALEATTPVAEDKIIAEVARQTAEGVRPLKAELKRARDEQRDARRKATLAALVGKRTTIIYAPDARVRQARIVEGLILARHEKVGTEHEFFAFGGMLSAIHEEVMPNAHGAAGKDAAAPAIPLISPLSQNHVLGEVESVAVFVRPNETGALKEMEVPSTIVSVLMDMTDRATPVVTGLVTHPIVLPTGEIVATDGIHPCGLALSRASVEGCRPYTQQEAAAALDRIREGLFGEFEFQSELDRDCAVAMLLTGVQRKVLDRAPGFASLASEPGTGKTTLAQIIHLILTGCDLSVTSFAERDPEEVKKTVFAALLRSPAMLCFDNITEGTTFRSSMLARVMTSTQLDERVLGFSRNALVSTSTLFVLTGNNLGLGEDEASRWLPVRLRASAVRVHHRRFKNADVVSFVRRVRADMLRDCIGIVAGYLECVPPEDTQKTSRFPTWGRMVCEPIVWAGGLRVSDRFAENERVSESFTSRRVVLDVLREQFADREFSARDVVRLVDGFSSVLPDDLRDALHDALEGLRARDASSSKSVGRVLKTLVGVRQETSAGVVQLIDAGQVDKAGVYRVVLSA